MDTFSIFAKEPKAVRGITIDGKLQKAVRSQNVGILTLTFQDIIENHPDQTFATIERRLRELDCLPHLVAVPAELSPYGFTPKWSDGTPRPYSLWICLYGRDEAEAKFREIGAEGYVQNFARLPHVGILAVTGPNVLATHANVC